MTNSFKFYQEIVDTHHCESLRRTAWWLDLPILWNDHNRFGRYPPSHRDTIKRKEGRKERQCFFCVMRALRIYCLKQHSCTSSLWVNHSRPVHCIASTYLSCNCKFVPSSPPPPPLTFGTYESALISCELGCCCFIPHIIRSYSICLALSDLFHLAYCFQGPSVLSQKIFNPIKM